MASTTVTQPTLTYFPFAGRVDYDYVAVTNWAELKPQYQAAGKTPFGQLPLYEEPGLVLGAPPNKGRGRQKKHGYNGTNDHEAALIDQAFEGVIDIVNRLVQVAFATPEDQKPEAKQKMLTEFLPAQLENFTKLLEKNGDNGLLVGSKLSYADVDLWAVVQALFRLLEGSLELVEKYPTIKSFLDGVSARDRIKAYLARDVYGAKKN